MGSEALKQPAEVQQHSPAPRFRERLAVALRGLEPEGRRASGLALAVAIVVALVLAAAAPMAEPIPAVLVLFWAWASRTPWREVGLARPRSWAATVAGGIALGAVFKIVMKALVMPLLGAPATNPAFHFVVGNASALLPMVLIVVFGAGFGEEMTFRGFLFERLGKLLGASARARVAIVLLTSIWFALPHWANQGLAGTEQALVTGLVFGSIFAVTRSLWLPMVAHAAFDVTALAIIYWDVESRVAHLIFP